MYFEYCLRYYGWAVNHIHSRASTCCTYVMPQTYDESPLMASRAQLRHQLKVQYHVTSVGLGRIPGLVISL